MSALAFAEYSDEKCLFSLSIWQQFLEVAKCAVFDLLLAFHAFEVVREPAVHANERVLNRHHFLLAQTDTPVCQVHHLLDFSRSVAQTVPFGLGTQGIGLVAASAFGYSGF